MTTLQLLDLFADHLSGKAIITPEWIADERLVQERNQTDGMTNEQKLDALSGQIHASLSSGKPNRTFPDVLPLRNHAGVHEYRRDERGVVVWGVTQYDIRNDSMRYRIEVVDFN